MSALKVEALVKVGGSLQKYPKKLRTLCRTLAEASERKTLIFVAGGGILADTVRRLDKAYHLDAEAAHWMATLCLDQYGLLLAQLIPNAKASSSLKEAYKLASRHIPTVFLPYRLLRTENPLEASWDVTSDSIAAYLAWRFKAEKLVLLKDVDGIFMPPYSRNMRRILLREIATDKLKKIGETCVDRKLPWLLEKFKLECFVISGLKPDRLFKILEGEPTIGTRIRLAG